jgi:anti-sigma factor RsiW
MSGDPRLLELIHADIDGTLPGADRAELAARLLADPAARQLHRDLQRTEAALRAAWRAEPPAGLADEILRATRDAPRGAASRPRGWGGFQLRYAASIAAALVIIGLGFGLTRDPDRTQALQGSAGGSLPLAGGAASPARATLRGDGFEASAALVRTPGGVRLELEAVRGGPVDVVARFDDRRVTPQSGAAPGPGTGSVVIPVGPAPGRAGVDFAALAPGAVTLRLELGGARDSAVELSLPPGP